MSDIVVTVPKNFDYYDPKRKVWLRGGHEPRIEKGERVYIVHNGKLRGYALLTRIHRWMDFEDDYDDEGKVDIDNAPPRFRSNGYALVRKGGAVAVTIDETIIGFRGFRYRWWKREDETPFPDWKTP